MRKATWKRLLTLGLTVALLASTLVVPAAAAEPSADLDAAKNSVAEVTVTQQYASGDKMVFKADNDVRYNYATRDDQLYITYAAELKMTEAMATYLQARQTQLMKADFTINVNMEMDNLDFTETGDTLTMTFKSTFLKPKDVKGDAYEYAFQGKEDGYFVYKITAKKAWAETQTAFAIPAELIVAYTNGKTYGYEEAKAAFTQAQLLEMKLMYADFTVADWMAPITLSLAELEVEAEVRDAVKKTGDSQTIVANGTIDGTFAYIVEKADSIGFITSYEKADNGTGRFVTTWGFGEDDASGIGAWVSNTVKLTLLYKEPVVDQPESPYLENEDHFAYIIGYPEGGVQPTGYITRAEVATIFFRMLNDETRNAYWKTTNDYDDVASTAWYNNAVSTLTNLGVINGMPDGGFHPDANITRAEFATMAARFFVGTEDYDTSQDIFNDVENHWARENINLAYLLGIINGYPDGTYLPQNVITRAEAMTIVNNTLRRSPVADGLRPVSEMITWPDNMNTSKWYYAAVQEATNSHEYTVDAVTGEETWTKILPVRDWVQFEKTWSDANSASNPGEVVKEG